MNDLAKVFWSGRSQAVRLPKQYRFEDGEVRIRREGRRVILEPVDQEISEAVAGIGEAAADEIEWLRRAIREGYDSGDAGPLDMEEIKRSARASFVPRD